MTILPEIPGIVSGVCLGTGIIHLFTGLRWPGGDRLHIMFSLFALSYPGAIAMSTLAYKAPTLNARMIIARWDGVFVSLTLIALP